MTDLVVTVWTKPNCVQCMQTLRVMDQEGIKYQTRRLDKSVKAVERFKEMGLMSAPIVETDTKRWSGFRVEKIRSLAKHLRVERMHGVNVPLEPITQVADEVQEDE
jgi:glutaredoxin-like protein NrdH